MVIEEENTHMKLHLMKSSFNEKYVWTNNAGEDKLKLKM